MSESKRGLTEESENMEYKRRSAAFGRAAALIVCLALCAGCGKREEYAQEKADIADSFPIAAEPVEENPQIAVSDGPYAVVHTTAGDVTVLLYPQQAPKAVENFIALAQQGYYDGSSFYYAKRDELVQGGRPAALDAYMGSGAAETGEPVPEGNEERSIWGVGFEDEFDDGLHHFPGAVGMAGAANGADQNLSQFYFLVQDKKAEDSREISASLYLNELIPHRTDELNEMSRMASLSDAQMQEFEDGLNAEIQQIATEGVPEPYKRRYEPAVRQYEKLGGAWGLDYKHTVFGQIIKGYNVAKAMSQVKVEASGRRPRREILIEEIEILDSLEE